MMNVLSHLVKLENNANEFGFSWENAGQIMAQIRSECDEVEVHLTDNNTEKLQEEIGDLLHAVFSLCVFCQLDSLETLTKSVNKFSVRFNKVKQLAQSQGLHTLKGLPFDELMKIWEQAKQ